MRTGLLVTGIVLFVVGVLLILSAATMDGAAASCDANFSCSGNGGGETLRAMATGLRTAGGLFGLAGVGMGIAGIVLSPPVATPPPVVAPIQVPVRIQGTCAKCGTASPEGAQFCGRCGAALARPCPSCGRSLDANARFCTGCGVATAPWR